MKLQKFSQTITRLRKNRKWSLPHLAEGARISKSLLYTIETNPRSNPTIGTLTKISRALGVDITRLVR
jgi:transcriptional regulator with XRE-family HTH domain